MYQIFDYTLHRRIQSRCKSVVLQATRLRCFSIEYLNFYTVFLPHEISSTVKVKAVESTE